MSREEAKGNEIEDSSWDRGKKEVYRLSLSVRAASRLTVAARRSIDVATSRSPSLYPFLPALPPISPYAYARVKLLRSHTVGCSRHVSGDKGEIEEHPELPISDAPACVLLPPEPQRPKLLARWFSFYAHRRSCVPACSYLCPFCCTAFITTIPYGKRKKKYIYRYFSRLLIERDNQFLRVPVSNLIYKSRPTLALYLYWSHDLDWWWLKAGQRNISRIILSGS